MKDKPPVRAHEMVVEAAGAAHPGLGLIAKMLRPFSSQAAIERGIGEVQLLGWIDQAATSAVEANINRLIAEGQKVTPDDLHAALKGVLQASESTIGADKRELLKRALVNAFDPELYKQGLAARVFKALAEVEYQDVLLLRDLSKRRGVFRLTAAHTSDPDRVDALFLGSQEWQDSTAQASLRALERHALVMVYNVDFVGSSGAVVLTGFGRHFLAYLREPMDPSAHG